LLRDARLSDSRRPRQEHRLRLWFLDTLVEQLRQRRELPIAPYAGRGLVEQQPRSLGEDPLTVQEQPFFALASIESTIERPRGHLIERARQVAVPRTSAALHHPRQQLGRPVNRLCGGPPARHLPPPGRERDSAPARVFSEPQRAPRRLRGLIR